MRSPKIPLSFFSSYTPDRLRNGRCVQRNVIRGGLVPSVRLELRTPQAKAADAINWKRLRSDVLEPLLAGRPARWQTFDFSAKNPDGTYGVRPDLIEREPADVIVIEGAYSAAGLSDLVDLSVLVDVPVEVRHCRLAAREEQPFLQAWHARWDAAEHYYFTHLWPPSSFDLVVTNDAGLAGNEPDLPTHTP